MLRLGLFALIVAKLSFGSTASSLNSSLFIYLAFRSSKGPYYLLFSVSVLFSVEATECVTFSTCVLPVFPVLPVLLDVCSLEVLSVLSLSALVAELLDVLVLDFLTVVTMKEFSSMWESVKSPVVM